MPHILVTRVEANRGRRKRSRLAPVLGLLLALGTAVPVAAADNGTVPGTVTVERIVSCILVTGSYDFGTQPLSTANAAAAPHRSATTAGISSCGSGEQDILVRGTDAAGDGAPPAAWGLSPGAVSAPCQLDTYGVGVLLASPANSPRRPVSLVDAPFSSLLPGLALEAAADLYMPCTGSSGGGETMTFSVVYTAIAVDAPLSEVEPNNDIGSAMPLVIDGYNVRAVDGAIDVVGDQDTYRVTLPAGSVIIETRDTSGNPSCAGIDTVVQLVQVVNNTAVGVASDDDGGIDNCSLVSTPIVTAGTYYIIVTDFGNDSLIPGYRLRINMVQPA